MSRARLRIPVGARREHWASDRGDLGGGQRLESGYVLPLFGRLHQRLQCYFTMEVRII